MLDPINAIAEWLQNLLLGWGLASGLVTFIMTLIGVLLVCIVVLLTDVFLVWLERKIVARFQDRIGPNRVGPYGLIQPIADVIKLLIKEDITPAAADKVVYNLAPIMALAVVLLMWAVIPFAPTIIGADINVAVLYIVAIGAIGTLGTIMAGWGSNNKYALLSAFRTVAQVIAYEIPMVVALMVPVLLARSMSIQDIVESQPIWFIVMAPVAAIILLISSIAETGRAPFDLVEAESELVAGFHIEYTGIKFAMFYAGELLHALTIGAIISSLFLGGWRGPGVNAVPILGVVWLFMKSFILYFVIAWVKYSLPRIRIDQMLAFNWKFLTPLALVVLMVTAIMDKVLAGTTPVGYALGMLLANLAIVWGTVLVLRKYASIQRSSVAEPSPIASPDLANITKSG
jgi:NADH-quinone oxidoreductase subunit H